MGRGITREYTVWCDVCVDWDRESLALTLKGAVEKWKRKGWKRSKAGRWLCPDCIEKRG